MKVNDITGGITEENIREQDLIIDPAKRTGPKPGFHSKAMVDHEVGMARSDCYNAAKHASEIFAQLRDVSETAGIPGWVASKITLAADYLNTVNDYLAGQAVQRDAGVVDEYKNATGDTTFIVLTQQQIAGKNVQQTHKVQATSAERAKAVVAQKGHKVVAVHKSNEYTAEGATDIIKGAKRFMQGKKSPSAVYDKYEKATHAPANKDRAQRKLDKISKVTGPAMFEQNVEEDSDPCWDNYEQIGMKKKNGRKVPNCVPKKK